MKHLFGMPTIKIKEELAGSLGGSNYRGKQIADWIYRRALPGQNGGAAADFQTMTDLPADLRKRLGSEYILNPLSIDTIQTDPADGVKKLGLRLEDGAVVEAVLLPDATRVSVCISSQAGCAMGCVFCATGSMGFTRNLEVHEIVAQLLNLQLQSDRRITHVVFMGMGEPLLNTENVIAAIHIIRSEIGISMRHITLSTVGIVKGIDRLADEQIPITLALSLHAPNDELRRRIVPSHKGSSTIAELMSACQRYFDKTGRRVTFEYVLLRGINDRPQDAEELAELLKNFPGALNVIPYNPVDVLERFEKPEIARIRAFRQILEDADITVTQRKERGQRISAACGQLVAAAKKRSPR